MGRGHPLKYSFAANHLAIMPPVVEYDPTGIEFYTIPSFQFSSGTTLHDLRVAYRSFNPQSTSGVVLIPTCFAGLINTTLNFTTPPHDCLSKYHVVVVAMLGNGESSSPSNKAMFPEPGELRYQDVVQSQYLLLTAHFKVAELEAVIGFSMGGQQAYHWGVMYPSFVKRLVPICSSARTSPHNYAFLEGPIAALSNSIDYIAWKMMKQKAATGEDVGANLKEVKPKKGLKAFGRAYSAWLTSHTWFRKKLWAQPGPNGVGYKTVEEWIRAREDGYLSQDADDLLALARMWQMGDVGTVIPGETELSQLGGGTGDDEQYKKALASIKAKVLLMPGRTDQYFPPDDSEIEVKYLHHSTLTPIESIWGHVAGGGLNPEDVKWMNEQIGRFMAE